ncbi:MAG: bifunctional aldolase/short-chain dehydrogenase [Desulfobacterales bacterium]|jgi:rhamnose utilization protein RhaD (predicted bifunctional aldolase and dehydrogenase)/NAD(P)-dependent dehydrogenase (short-subunit alcohol dehydrogenase family)
MKSLWNDKEAKACAADPVQLRVYTSRLLGQEENLVLHGGGNTSVKAEVTNVFGDREKALYIKGSGIDLKTIEAHHFTPLRLELLRRMAAMDTITDSQMVRMQRTAMIDHESPNPSLEAVLHAIIPFQYVDHTHADEVVVITNNQNGEKLIHEIYGQRVLLVPYTRAGFVLAKTVYKMTQNIDWRNIEGLILMNHGLCTFGDDARTSYERMLDLVSQAQDFLKQQGALEAVSMAEPEENLPALSRIRREISQAWGLPVIAIADQSQKACGFSRLANVAPIASLGPITADHIIRTKPRPVILGANTKNNIDDYVSAYIEYFNRNTDGQLAMLDPVPRWAVWPRFGTIAFGKSAAEARIVSDIVRHTIEAIQYGEALGGWQPLSEKHIFEMEYWELQQAKLEQREGRPEFEGKIALVTGAASGIGLACAEALKERGAVVVGLDVNPECTLILDDQDAIGITCDVTDIKHVKKTIEATVRQFGGLDILISNAGLFTANQKIEDMDEEAWYRSMELNLSSHQRLLKACIPYLKHGIDPAVVVVASKNVPAPGPGAAAYSVAKAGLTQMARIAAMELGPYGIRVNTIHPDAVYDTALWTPEVLEQRAKHYGLSVDEYKTKNILKTEVSAKDVANLVCALVGPAFAKITGAQIPIDGGNERVI